MLAAGHKGRALLGGCLTQAYNADTTRIQRGYQDEAQGQGGVQDRPFEAEHATTRPEWVWRHVTPTPCTNEMSARKSLSCE